VLRGNFDLMQITYAVTSEIGLKRKKNEDSFRAINRQSKIQNDGNDEMIFVIADGMGGHPCGELASFIACEMAIHIFKDIGAEKEAVIEQLKKGFHFIDDTIRKISIADKECHTMGTTLTALVILQKIAIIAHVGDCRVYIFRDDMLQPLTTDHSFVQEMVNEGLIHAELADTHPFRNKLTQVVGTDEPLETVSTYVINIKSGDRFIVSSDGLHGEVSFRQIEEIVSNSNNPNDTVNQLLKSAMKHGGRDNATVAVIHLNNSWKLD